ncbi:MULTISPECIES: DUF6133 family protein [unclassified Dehalobacter]|uniref:DUF6133 family protein n=1 Tax=unclassified Dehalobacter TaxID=2635733 RepID=UPI000E6C178F|nr:MULTISPECIES: DUF6133 family protein [unclassified Dehalobacter]RJE46606.1 hypothetical protein A7K50_12640 [Dehalobacter sp. MCB1]TCX47374.1 hypothetical protein C1I36_13800 [Dehalobacter sp. 14DCB1]TCX55587.1 hypothetical protein C1I38_02765 [Dehalobacter sp. 12DCB1]
MKKFIKKLINKAVSTITRVIDKIRNLFFMTRVILCSQRGEGFVDTAVKILISVVVGALILSALYALFGETILPTLRDRIVDMFNYGN